jgi:hypothetical protein
MDMKKRIHPYLNNLHHVGYLFPMLIPLLPQRLLLMLKFLLAYNENMGEDIVV